MKKLLVLLLLISAFAAGLWKLHKARNFQVAGELVSHVPNADSLVALTFDDGPTPAYTDEVLEVLSGFNVPATFFVTGRETENNIEEARKIVAAGHQLGNHSYSHQQMVLKGTGFLRTELERTDQAIRNAGYEGEIYFRPPFGKKLFLLPRVLSQRDQVSVTWDIEPESYTDIRVSAEKIAGHVEENVQPGSIILLHLMYESREESRRALPLIIRSLQEKGYTFVSLNELMEKR